jgi:pilus assembly protein CpaF
MNTGHDGSLTTVHANSPRDAVARLEQMVGMAGFAMTETSIRSQIASAIKLVVQLQRFADGKRRVTSISEITGLEGSVVLMQEIFKLVRTKSGSEAGEFRATGLRPSFLAALELNGAALPENTFHPGAMP